MKLCIFKVMKIAISVTVIVINTLYFISDCIIETIPRGGGAEQLYKENSIWADPEGGRGSGPPPPVKSQVIWVSIGNKQLNPPPPWKKLDPPPPLKNDGPPLEPWKIIVFFESNHLTSGTIETRSCRIAMQYISPLPA